MPRAMREERTKKGRKDETYPDYCSNIVQQTGAELQDAGDLG